MSTIVAASAALGLVAAAMRVLREMRTTFPELGGIIQTAVVENRELTIEEFQQLNDAMARELARAKREIAAHPGVEDED